MRVGTLEGLLGCPCVEICGSRWPDALRPVSLRSTGSIGQGRLEVGCLWSGLLMHEHSEVWRRRCDWAVGIGRHGHPQGHVCLFEECRERDRVAWRDSDFEHPPPRVPMRAGLSSALRDRQPPWRRCRHELDNRIGCCGLTTKVCYTILSPRPTVQTRGHPLRAV